MDWTLGEIVNMNHQLGRVVVYVLCLSEPGRLFWPRDDAEQCENNVRLDGAYSQNDLRIFCGRIRSLFVGNFFFAEFFVVKIWSIQVFFKSLGVRSSFGDSKMSLLFLK